MGWNACREHRRRDGSSTDKGGDSHTQQQKLDFPRHPLLILANLLIDLSRPGGAGVAVLAAAKAHRGVLCMDGCAVKGTLDASGFGERPIPASRGSSALLYAEGKQRETTGRIGLKYKSSVLLTAGIGRGNRVRIAIALKAAATFVDASDRMGPARCKIECRMRRRKASEGTNRSRHTVSDVHGIETKQSKQATTGMEGKVVMVRLQDGPPASWDMV